MQISNPPYRISIIRGSGSRKNVLLNLIGHRTDIDKNQNNNC